MSKCIYCCESWFDVVRHHFPDDDNAGHDDDGDIFRVKIRFYLFGSSLNVRTACYALEVKKKESTCTIVYSQQATKKFHYLQHHCCFFYIIVCYFLFVCCFYCCK